MKDEIYTLAKAYQLDLDNVLTILRINCPTLSLAVDRRGRVHD